MTPAAEALGHLRAYMAAPAWPAPARRRALMAAADALADAPENAPEAGARRLIDLGQYQAAVKLLEASTGQISREAEP